MAAVFNDNAVLIRGGRVLTPSGFVEDGAVLIQSQRVSFIGPSHDLPTVHGECIEFDASSNLIVPGFVDIHVHGAHGVDTMDGSYEALSVMSKALPKYGTTAFLPTTVTADQESLKRAARAVAEARRRGTEGADVVGMHLEGPFISPNYKGAQNSDHVRLPSIEELESLTELSSGAVRLVTLAPELPGALEAISWLVEHGVTVSIGHSQARFDDVAKAVDRGLSHSTHTFNGMTGFHHREPGAVGAIMTFRNIDAEIIADMVHVHKAAIRVLLEAKGIERVILITDAIRAMGMPDGEYELGGLQVTVVGGIARLKEGNLAGSTLTMMQAVKNMVKHVGVSLEDAICMATINPARAVGLGGQKGSLAVGKDGDVVILDGDLNVRTTIVRGRIVYHAG